MSKKKFEYFEKVMKELDPSYQLPGGIADNYITATIGGVKLCCMPSTTLINGSIPQNIQLFITKGKIRWKIVIDNSVSPSTVSVYKNGKPKLSLNCDQSKNEILIINEGDYSAIIELMTFIGCEDIKFLLCDMLNITLSQAISDERLVSASKLITCSKVVFGENYVLDPMSLNKALSKRYLPIVDNGSTLIRNRSKGYNYILSQGESQEYKTYISLTLDRVITIRNKTNKVDVRIKQNDGGLVSIGFIHNSNLVNILINSDGIKYQVNKGISAPLAPEGLNLLEKQLKEALPNNHDNSILVSLFRVLGLAHLDVVENAISNMTINEGQIGLGIIDSDQTVLGYFADLFGLDNVNEIRINSLERSESRTISRISASFNNIIIDLDFDDPCMPTRFKIHCSDTMGNSLEVTSSSINVEYNHPERPQLRVNHIINESGISTLDCNVPLESTRTLFTILGSATEVPRTCISYCAQNNIDISDLTAGSTNYGQAVIERILASSVFIATIRSTIDLLIGEGKLGSVVTLIQMLDQSEKLIKNLDAIYTAKAGSNLAFQRLENAQTNGN